MSEELTKKLTAVEDDLRSLREDKAAKERELSAVKTKYEELVAEDQDTKDVHAQAMTIVRDKGEIVERIEAANALEKDLLKLLGDKEAAQRNGDTPKAKRPKLSLSELMPPPGPQDNWSSAALFEDEEIRAQLDFISGSKSRFGSIQLGEVTSRDAFAAGLELTATMREGRYRGILPQLLRPLSVLALIPTGTTDGNLVPYTQESGPLTGAAETAEGDVKPEATMVFTDEDAPVRTIAAWMKLRKQALADFSALRSIVDTRLRYLVQRRLEGQILAGDGSGSNLTGILNTPGIGSVAYDASVPLTEHLLSGMTNIFLAEGAADGIVLHPADWQAALTEKADNGTYGSLEYRGGGPFGSTPQSLWGVPCVPAAVMPQGTGIVADFGLGATLLIREGVNVLVSDSDQDDFIRNRVTMLGETRVAFPVWRPSVFQEVELA